MNPLSPDQQALIRARIRRVMAEKTDGKQQELAKKSKITPAIMSKLLNGHDPVIRRYLIRIEKATGARLEWLERGMEPIYWKSDEMPARSETEYYEGSLLRLYLHKKTIESSHLAKLLKRSKTTIQGYFETETLSKANRDKILGVLNATYNEVFGGYAFTNAGQAQPPANRYESISVLEGEAGLVDVMEIPLSARSGSGYADYFSSMTKLYTKVPPHMLYEGVAPELHVIVTVDGDSMQPRLDAGYRMLAYECAPGELPKLNSIVLVDYRGELLIKELTAIDDVENTIVLRSSNGGATRRIALAEIAKVCHVYRYFDAQLPV